ncbi:MAG: heparinase II/III family protein [Cytophagales bacterium]|nr:heparinase II/III family protein [Cytophagales bacterium]
MKIRIISVFIVALFFTPFLGFTQYSDVPDKINWRELTSVEDVCKAFPQKMKAMLAGFNLDYPGLEKVKLANEKGDLPKAGTHLLDYYSRCNNARHLRKAQPAVTAETDALADTILKNVFVIQNVRGEVPYGEDGHRDWYYKGPNNDREWAWLSNRHSQMNHVLSSYFDTGNPKYAKYIDLFLRDFIVKSMPYPAVKSSTSVWRGLEVAARAKVWSRIFYGLINSDYLLPSTRLLMLSSLPDHAHYNRNFHGSNNWLTMEISALATVATNFPEYKPSGAWLDYSVKTMMQSMKEQVYADGVQTELTSHYHNVSLRNFELFKNICDQANKPLPDFFNETIEDMYAYIARAMRPSGYRILNNDGDLGSDRAIISAGARKFNNAEWEYLATNGASGTRPSDGPSWFYPWAGQLISRSGYDTNAHWSFFDVGPWGSGHQHNDKLHISISAYGRDLLVDAGRFAYTGEVAEKFRGYARGTQGHNTVLIDGKGQKPDVRVVDQPLSDDHYKITSDFDYAWNSFDKYHDLERVKHTRSVLYVRGNFWVVLDRIESEAPRKIETLWHWHPECKVQVGKEMITSTKNDKGNLKIIPVGKTKWNIDEVTGQESPEIQGWYSAEYNKYEPNVATIYSTDIKSDVSFIWLLIPFDSSSPEIEAKVISKSIEGVELSITDKNKGQWEMTIPYANSNLVKLAFGS